MTTYFRRLLDPSKEYRVLVVAHDRRVLKVDGTLAPIGAEFDDETFLHPMQAFPEPLPNLFEAAVNVTADTEPFMASVFVLELDDDGELKPPTAIENWYFDPTGARDVFGALYEPVTVTQSVINQNYAPPMRG